MILILDDLRTPEMLGYKKEDCIVVRNIKSLIEIFNERQEEFSIVTLDHDLGKEDIRTGYDFLSYLEKAVYYDNIKKIHPEILIHSANPVGAKNMKKALEKINNILEEKKEQDK